MKYLLIFILTIANSYSQIDDQAYALKGIKEIILKIDLQYDGMNQNKLSISEEYIKDEIKYKLNLTGVKCREFGNNNSELPILNFWISFSDLEQYDYKNTFEYRSEMFLEQKLYVPNAKRKMYCTVWKGYRVEGKGKYNLWKNTGDSTIDSIIESIKGFIIDYNDVN